MASFCGWTTLLSMCACFRCLFVVVPLDFDLVSFIWSSAFFDATTREWRRVVSDTHNRFFQQAVFSHIDASFPPFFVPSCSVYQPMRCSVNSSGWLLGMSWREYELKCIYENCRVAFALSSLVHAFSISLTWASLALLTAESFLDCLSPIRVMSQWDHKVSFAS